MSAVNPPTAPDQQRFIICMKWGTKYGPEYVNRLYGMAARHLKGAFRFVCFTDDSAGVRPEVECLPLPETHAKAGKRDGGWKKLGTYQADLFGLQGTALFLDLDVVIVGDLTEFFEVPGEFLIIKDWKRPWRVTGNSSVYRFRLGAHADVLQHFIDHQDEVRAKYRNEQEFLSHHLAAQGKLGYWPKHWCASFKYHCLPLWPTSYWRDPFIPAGARVLVFHGVMNPPDALVGRSNGNWRHARPARWISDHWRE
ncbi:glycosyltransferase [Roseateles paludis]|jgi:hypothetical protein|uniref:Glycosyltransferase n=1 Tax=Roseateles paludis TaxID=3145238 RepID=A0ABV0G3W7_9BURK